MVETREHLFFSCSFSQQVWSSVASKIKAPTNCSWDILVQWGSGLKRKSLSNLIEKLSWQASIYNIWRERNQKVHSNVACSPASVCEMIFQDLKFRILGLPDPASVDKDILNALGIKLRSSS